MGQVEKRGKGQNMTIARRSIGPAGHFQSEEIAPGIIVRRLHPGGAAGPNGETRNDFPGGQTWSEYYSLGSDNDAFTMIVPDVRMPPNQLWPLHWHDCWTVVVILEGNCLIGDWYMAPGDVFVAAPSVEYGPLLNGPKGCRLLEIFADVTLSLGGYAPEYRDHPTLRGGDHAFKPRSAMNKRNEGRSSMALDGVEGVWKTRLASGWSWDLGASDDPDRGVVRALHIRSGERVTERSRGDWYGALVLEGSVQACGKTMVRDDVLIAERGAVIPDMIAGSDGVHLLETFRTARAL
jgi:hypothetical protein